jgi:SPP1 family phage portal protein
MRIQEIMALNDPKKIFDKLCVDKIDSRDLSKNLNEFAGQHKILERPDKMIGKDAEVLADGKRIPSTKKIVSQAKLVLRIQDKIVRMAAAFLFGKPVKMILEESSNELDNSFELLKKTLRDVKIDYFNKRLARQVFIESKAAELWYLVPKMKADEKGDLQLEGAEIKVVLLCKKRGDEIYPHFDEYGDMDAFIRRYSALDIKGRAIEYTEIYTAEKIYYYKKSISGNSYETMVRKNLIGKIPVVYYDQEETEWAKVQRLIERLELVISKHADTNDYFASPSVVGKGEIESAPTKEEVGKFFQIKAEYDEAGKPEYGSLEYLTWDQSPESLRLEIQNLLKFIYSLTETPDLSFNNLKDIGSNLSGIAIQMMFLDSILKSYEKQEIFGEGLDRRVNILKAMLSQINVKEKAGLDKMVINHEFGSIMPENVKEIIESLAESRPGANLISEETAMKHHPFVSNHESEGKLMAEEKKQDMGESYE